MQASAAPSYTTGEHRSSRWLRRVVFGLTGVYLVALVVTHVLYNQPVSFQMRWTPYALPTMLAWIANIVAMIAVFRLKEANATVQWLALMLWCIAVWDTSEILMRLSSTPGAETLWAKISTLGSAYIPASFYMFALSYVGSRRATHPFTLVLLMATGGLSLYVDVATPLIDVFDPAQAVLAPWGYVLPVGPFYMAYTGWFMLIGLASLAEIFLFRRRTPDPVIRRQSFYIMLAIAIPLLLGAFTDAILPAFNTFTLPSMGPMLTAAIGAGITYSIIRFRSFQFTPVFISEHILATMNEAVLGLRPDLTVSYANPGAKRLLGGQSSNLSNRQLESFLAHAPGQDNIAKRLRSRTHVELDAVKLLPSPQAQAVTVKLSSTRLTAAGETQGYLVVLTDITPIAESKAIIEQQVAEQTAAVRQAQARLDSSVNSLELGLLITDATPEVVMANQFAHRLFCSSTAHNPAGCPKMKLERLAEQLPGTVKFVETIKHCLAERSPQRISLLSLAHRSWRVYLSPVLEDGQPSGVAILFEDITEEQIISRSKDEFFSIASHELRTPLTAIKGNSSLIMQYYPQSLENPSVKEMIHDIHSSSDRLITIVNDFLDVSRLEQGRITYRREALDLARIAGKVMTDLEGARPTAVQLKLGEGLTGANPVPPVLADTARLTQILYNLIGNALKFTDKGSVTLTAKVVGKRVVLSVADSGPGIDAEMQPLLFRKFQQAGESLLTRDASGGTGLGLYISRMLAEGMGGTVRLERSAPGEGTTFCVELPLAPVNKN